MLKHNLQQMVNLGTVMRNILPTPYRRVIYIALAQHVPLVFLCVLLPFSQKHLRYQRTAIAVSQYIIIAIAAHWGGILCVMLRNPKEPADADKLFVALGFLPIGFSIFVMALLRNISSDSG